MSPALTRRRFECPSDAPCSCDTGRGGRPIAGHPPPLHCADLLRVEFVIVPAVLARLEKVAPGIKLRLTSFGNDLAETGVVSGTTALVLGRIVDPPDNLVVQHLMDEGPLARSASIIRPSAMPLRASSSSR